MQSFSVASGIIINDHDQVALVQNRRRNGSLDWSTPGGVVDPGEQILEALQREVLEETALTVRGWSPMIYRVEVHFVERDLRLCADVFLATGYGGTLLVDDPDEVVVDGRWVDHAEALRLLSNGPQWVTQPLVHALSPTITGLRGRAGAVHDAALWRYDVVGNQSRFTALLIEGPSD